MQARETANSLWWLIHKDLIREVRTPQVWPGMMLLGLVLVFLLATQLDLPLEQKGRVAGGLLWLAIFFAGTIACDRSFSSERDAGCWLTLSLYPIPPSVLFLAKLIVNFIALVALEIVLIPLFVALSDVSLASRPGPLILIAALGNVGFAAVGTVVSGLTCGLRHRGGLLALILLPLVIPVIFGTAEATRLLVMGQTDLQWGRWIQLLAVFAFVFTVIGALVFEFVVED